MPNSSVIGKPLSVLSPNRWLVAAVYRENTLVVPHGETRFERGDRILLVGDPSILPSIARFLSTGHSEFPLSYGSGIGVVASNATSTVASEVDFLLNSTQADFIQFLGQFGFAFLMFLAGMEIDFTRVERLGRKGIAVTFLAASSAFLLALGVVLLFKQPLFYLLVLGAMSLGIVLVALRDAGLGQTRLGQITLIVGSIG